MGYFTYQHSQYYHGKIQFNGSSTADAYLYDFGDGTTSSQKSPLHTYTNIGTPYTVKLTMTNSCGATVYNEVITPKYATGNAAFYCYDDFFFNSSLEFIEVTLTGPYGVNMTDKIVGSQFLASCYDTGVIRFEVPWGNYTYTAVKSTTGQTQTGTVEVLPTECKVTQLIF
ncbi:MAG: PKD domain-containing protein [Bacteroidetes bacterium]|nr:PKD domain-containing protein [Bacteroidota bacterium]